MSVAASGPTLEAVAGRPFLSPRQLLRDCGERLRVDRTSVVGWTLWDVGWSASHTPGLRLEFRRNRRGPTMQVRVEDTATGLAASYSHLPGHRPDDYSEVGRMLSERVSQFILAASLSHHRIGQRPTEPDFVGGAEFESATHEAIPPSERTLLAIDQANYRERYGVAPQVVVGARTGEAAVRYPVTSGLGAGGALMAAPRAFSELRGLREYFASLNFGIGTSSHVEIVPTPAVFELLASRGGQQRGPVTPRLIVGHWRFFMTPRAWVRALTGGVLPIPVASRGLGVATALATRFTGPRFAVDVGMLPHDMGLHMLGWHRIPGVVMTDLLRFAGERVATRPWAFGRVAQFFECTLTLACQDAWRAAVWPTDFDAHFERRYSELEADLRCA